MELSKSITDATVEIFTAMVMMDITPGSPITEQLKPLRNSITGMVGLAGTHKGVLAIHVPNGVAIAITSNFLGMEVTSVDEDVQDAIGEVANMLAGSVKSILADSGREIQLSLPSTIQGEEYRLQAGDDIDKTIIPFSTNGESFLVELQLQRDHS